MTDELPVLYPERLTRAGQYLSAVLEETGLPVLTAFGFFRVIWQMYQQAEGERLYLRNSTPTQEDFSRLRRSLKKSGFIGADPDYGTRIIRVLTVSDLPAEDILCLVDPTAYVSHLSAMQRWGLTNRRPEHLLVTRPDRETATKLLRSSMESELGLSNQNLFPVKIISHPEIVRRRPVQVFEAKNAGAWIERRGSHARLSSIGQTFLDMLQKPDLCGGMGHVLEIWESHAASYLDEIVRAIDSATSPLVKSRAGYIIEERLGHAHPGVEAWKALGQRGSSRKLDPSKEFASVFSETWMISLNV